MSTGNSKHTSPKSKLNELNHGPVKLSDPAYKPLIKSDTIQNGKQKDIMIIVTSPIHNMNRGLSSNFS